MSYILYFLWFNIIYLLILSFIPQTYDSPWLSSPPLPCAPQGILKAEEKTETLFPGFPKHSQSALLSTKTDFTEKEL